MWNIIKNVLNQKKWARWAKTPTDLVILHTFGKANGIPSASPFVMKTQTYLRMTKIPHQIDSKDMIGPKGKAPWISLNGVHLGDSELIIRHLNKHFKIDPNKVPYSERELATAACARVTLEEHFLWGLALERFVYNPSQFQKIVGVSPIYDKLLVTVGGYVLNKRADGQGIGRHSKEDVEELCSRDLRFVSTIMGSNKYLLGDVPCQADCAVFGILAVVLWGLPDSPYQKLLENELTNLKDYCYRMRDQYYPDWEKCIRGPRKQKEKVSTMQSNSPEKDKANKLKAKL